MSRALRVGYVSDADPRSRWSWSGAHYYMFRALQEQGFDVCHIGEPLLAKSSALTRLRGKLGFWGGGQADVATDEIEAARTASMAVQTEAERRSCDVLFAPLASKLIAFLQTSTPVVYMSDATFRLLHGSYADTASLPAEVIASRDELEQRAIDNASLLVYPSAWAARSAMADYGAANDRVRLIPLGANLDSAPSADEVAQKRRDSTCRLLFIGRDWERKGGDIALDALMELRRMGIRAELTICGSTPPSRQIPEGVRVFDNLDKSKPRQRATFQDLLMRAHFLVFPTRAECFGMVVCEANAFGVPVIATATGGVPIEEGQNGYGLPLHATGKEFAEAIAGAYRDDQTYANLVSRTRTVFTERLSWGAWGRSVGKEILALAVSQENASRSVA
jgi:glycosyltransferase involved in cell wall biosynthesis